MRMTWEVRDAARLIGTNVRRLQGWSEKSLLVPSVAGGGKGSRRLYSFTDLCMGVVLLGVQNAVGARSDLVRRAAIRKQVEPLATKLQEVPEDVEADVVLALVSRGTLTMEGRDGEPPIDISATIGSFGKIADFIKGVTELGAPVIVLPVTKPLMDLADRCAREVEF